MLSEKGEEGEEMSGNGNVELLEGPITGALVKLSLPIMGTSLIQMAYNLTDMIWVGRLSSDAVAAVGVAGMYLWLSRGLAAFPRMGGQIRVGQCLGGREKGGGAQVCPERYADRNLSWSAFRTDLCCFF